MPDPDFLKELPEDLWGVARALVAAAAGKDPSAHGAAFLTFREAAFRDSATVAPSARFLTSLYDGDEALLAGWVQPAELVQELSAGQADLSLAVAGHWAVTKDWPRVIQITDALLTARMHLRSDNALSIMCALCTTLAFRRPHRANDLLAHVEECVKSGSEPESSTLNEARSRVKLGKVVAAAEESVRDFWDQRLTAPRKMWSWHSQPERQALSDVAGWLPEDEGVRAAFQAVVPEVWWDLFELHDGMVKELSEKVRIQRSVEVYSQAGAEVAPKPASVEEVSRRRRRSEADDGASEKGVPWGWFLAGGLVGVFCWGMVSGPLSGWLSPKGAISDVNAAEAGEGQTSTLLMDQPNEEMERLTEELRHVGNLDMLRAASWHENASLLMGRATELPFSSKRYADLLILLHWAPSTDSETRLKVPELLLDRSPDGEMIDLWEKVIRLRPEMKMGIQVAAAKALNQVSARWTTDQRGRLEALVADAES